MMVRVGDIHQSDDATIAVPETEREGVFIHAFKCRSCSLHFHIFSWRANRHRSGNVYCPECGQTTPMFQQRACVNESPDFSTSPAANEIWNLWELAGVGGGPVGSEKAAG